MSSEVTADTPHRSFIAGKTEVKFKRSCEGSSLNPKQTYNQYHEFEKITDWPKERLKFLMGK